MRIPFPESIPLRPLVVLLSLFLLVQLLEGTDPLFALLIFVAQLAGFLAFNSLGGMSHVTGAFCLLSLLPNVTVPELTHAVVLQPGNFSLEAPLATASANALFYLCVLVSAHVSKMFRVSEPFLDKISFSDTELLTLSSLCAGVSLMLSASFLAVERVENGSPLALLMHFYPLFIPISIMIATHLRLKMTHGVSCMSWYIAAILLAAIIPGVLHASKEGMLLPPFCWLLVCAANGYRFSKPQVVGLLTVLLLAWVFVYPYSQNARTSVGSEMSIPAKLGVIRAYLADPASFVRDTQDSEGISEFGDASSKVNIIQRYSMMKFSDLLIVADGSQDFTGIEPYVPIVFSLIPHFIWPNRPESITNNAIGHKAGIVRNEEDVTTGITVGSPAVFYDLGGWLALVVYSLLLFVPFFVFFRMAVGGTTQSIWGLALVGRMANSAGILGPDSIFQMVTQFLITLLLLVGFLKVLGYISEKLIVKPAMP